MATLQATQVTGSYCSISDLGTVQYLTLPIYGAPGIPPVAVPQGSIWYNSQNSYIMGQTCLCVATAPAWSTGGAMGANRRFGGGAGTLNAGLAAFGLGVTPVGNQATSQEYDGTTWSNSNSATTARYAVGMGGNQNDAIAMGGTIAPASQTCHEKYNGTNWANCTASPVASSWWVAGVNSANVAYFTGGGPTNNCTVCVATNTWTGRANLTTGRVSGGNAGAGDATTFLFTANGNTATNVTECYQATPNTWTTKANAPVSLRNASAWGTANAAMNVGGRTPGTTTCALFYNGTNNVWSACAAMPASVFGMLPSNKGSENAGFAAGGNNPSTSTTYEFQTGLACTAVCVCWCRRGPYTPI
jgi:hypothetical protein